MFKVGIDCGTKSVKVVLLSETSIAGRGTCLTGSNVADTLSCAMNAAWLDAGKHADHTFLLSVTQSGACAIPNADVVINDFSALALAAHYLKPSIRTVIDVGAEGSRAVKCNENGIATDFVVNERCAAGTGAFMESMARALEVSVEEMGKLALQSEKPVPLSAQCAIFAESEVIGLIHAKTSTSDISRSIHDALASRVAGMVRRIRVEPDIMLIGGMALNPGFTAALERELGLAIFVPEFPQYASALGAALAANHK